VAPSGEYDEMIRAAAAMLLIATRTVVKYFSCYQVTSALWDPKDASSPTLEIMGTKCRPIWFRPTFATGCHVSLSNVGGLQCFPDLLADLRGVKKSVGEGIG